MPEKLEPAGDGDKAKLPPFVLPPGPSPLLARLESFLPRIRQANEQLAQPGTDEAGNATPDAEAVVLEPVSSSSGESSSSEEDDSDSDDGTGSDDNEQDSDEDGSAMDEDEGETAAPLSHLMDISSRPIKTNSRVKAQNRIVELPQPPEG